MSAGKSDLEQFNAARRRALAAIGTLPLAWSGAMLLGAGCAQVPAGAGARMLRPAPAAQAFGLPSGRPTGIWAFDGGTPGPVLRFRQGETAEIEVLNGLPQPTTVHWHGLRVPNAMDGVPYATQPPIPPGDRFRYQFALPDAGTYWYHPHYRSFEQVTRGLYGAFIVEEAQPPAVDEDQVWVLADWLLDADGALLADFEDPRDMSHAGRIGNLVTLNGHHASHRDADPEPLRLRAGTRLRLRLLNAASARIFALYFSGVEPVVIAHDGHPLEPHPLAGGNLLLGPGSRTDLILDLPAGRVTVQDRHDPRRPFILRELIGEGAARPRAPVAPLPANRLPEPNLERARRHEIVLDGGARGRLRSARVQGKDVPVDALLREHGMAWAMNGVAANDQVHEPLLTLATGESCILRLTNRTQWPHPMHLHGHAFRVLRLNGQPTRYREWRDTVILDPNGSAEIAFVADNPGIWMFHCHILQHQQGGMMACIRVSDDTICRTSGAA
jgi:FtsP/CotA-like multicopper oxidase with cupredoxin domain